MRVRGLIETRGPPGTDPSTLRAQMKGRPCLTYSSDMKVRIESADASKYPDVVALCGERKFYDRRRDLLLNPSVIIEVLSPSTEAYDRGGKFAIFRRLPSLHESSIHTMPSLLRSGARRH